jgi:hypothetical protein
MKDVASYYVRFEREFGPVQFKIIATSRANPVTWLAGRWSTGLARLVQIRSSAIPFIVREDNGGQKIESIQYA